MLKQAPQLILLAPDELSSRHVLSSITAAEITRVLIFTPSQALAAKAAKAVESTERPVILIVSSTKLRRSQLDLAQLATIKGGTVLVWSAGSEAEDKVTDAWILDRLLQQRNSLVSTSLALVIEAARLAIFGGNPRLTAFRIFGRFGDLAPRFKTILKNRGVSTTTGKKSDAFVFTCLKDGIVRLKRSDGESIVLNDLDNTANAISLLASSSSNTTNNTSQTFDQINTEAVRMIARPPARLLSETTSKKLAAAFGLNSGPERLCQSPTEASRFATELGFPVVLKLVRPALDNKEAQDAVVVSIQNGATVRQVFHKLKLLADNLGPPKPLGVLVAKEISDGTRVWLKMVDHKLFGRIIFMGTGDRPTSKPDLALTLPISLPQAQSALAMLYPQRPGTEITALTEGVLRFSNMLNQLDKQITRAEIHPLVAGGNNPAIALDALFSISNFDSNNP